MRKDNNRLLRLWDIDKPRSNTCRFCGTECMAPKTMHMRCRRIEEKKQRELQCAMDV